MHQLSYLSSQIHFRPNLPVQFGSLCWKHSSSRLHQMVMNGTLPSELVVDVNGDFPGTSPILCRHKYVTSFSQRPRQGWGTTPSSYWSFSSLGVSRWTIISNRCGLGEVARPQREPNWTQQPAVSRMGYGLAKYNTHVNDRWVKEAG